MNLQQLQKLSIIGSVGIPAKYGGFETLVHHLVKNINKQFDITVYCSGKAYPKPERPSHWNGAKLEYIPLQANGLQSIFYDLWSMIRAIRKSDILLILGVSGCLFLPFFKLFSNKRIIVNIDGMEWRRPKWNKLTKLFLLFSEMIACKYADEIVTDNRIIKEYVKIRYGVEGNLIEYGADHVFIKKFTPENLSKYKFMGADYAFKVARIEPENNLHLILKVFSETPVLPLVIVGNWENSIYGRNLKAKYKNIRNIYLLDPIYDQAELNLIRSNAKIYIHGHSAGGTNPSLVEAMYLRLPVLAYDVLFNRATTKNQGLFFSSAEELKSLITNLHIHPLPAIANSLKNIAINNYTWKIIADKYRQLALGKNNETIRQLCEPDSLNISLYNPNTKRRSA